MRAGAVVPRGRRGCPAEGELLQPLDIGAHIGQWMRPPASLPRTLVKSMPNSRATLRNDGDAGGGTPLFDS